jgi:uncharacterized protein (DUF885 family)
MLPVRGHPLVCLLLLAACRSHHPGRGGRTPAAPQPTVADSQRAERLASAVPGDSASDTIGARVTALADTYLAAYFDQYPELITYYGVPGGRHDQLRDNSLAALERWQAQEDQWLAALRRIDPARFAGSPEWVTYGTLREELEASGAERVCHNELWGVSQG